MNATQQVLEQYRALATVHRAMLARARDDDWEGVGELARRADEIRAELVRMENSGAHLREDAEPAKATLIEETLGLIAEIRSLAEPAHATRADQLANDAVRQKVKGTYGV